MYEDEEKCGICLDPYLEFSITYVTTCNHKFHGGCFSKWHRNSRTCPFCRSQVPKFELPVDEIALELRRESISEFVEQVGPGAIDDCVTWGGELPIEIAMRTDVPDRVCIFLNLRNSKPIPKHYAALVRSRQCAHLLLDTFRAKMSFDGTRCIFSITREHVGMLDRTDSLIFGGFGAMLPLLHDADIVCDESRFSRAVAVSNFTVVEYFLLKHPAVFACLDATVVGNMVDKHTWVSDEHLSALFKHTSMKDPEFIRERMYLVFEKDNTAFVRVAIDSGTLTAEMYPIFNLAIEMGAYKCASVLIKYGGWTRLDDIVHSDNNECTHERPLLNILRAGHYVLAKDLLQRCKAKTDHSTLFLAMKSGEIELVRKLIPDYEQPRFLLHIACSLGVSRVVKWILDTYFPNQATERKHISFVDNVGWQCSPGTHTPLSIAVGNGHCSVVKLLLTRGFTVLSEVTYGITAFDFCKSGEIFELLLSGADPKIPIPASALKFAIIKDRLDVVRRLVAYYKIQILDKAANESMLVYAIDQRRFDIALELLSVSNDVNHFTSESGTYPVTVRSALTAACDLRYSSTPKPGFHRILVEKLLDAGVNPNIGTGIMHCIALAWDTDILNKVLEKTCDRQRQLNILLCNLLDKLDTFNCLEPISNVLDLGADPLSIGLLGKSEGILQCIAKSKIHANHQLIPRLGTCMGLDINEVVYMGKTALEVLLDAKSYASALELLRQCGDKVDVAPSFMFSVAESGFKPNALEHLKLQFMLLKAIVDQVGSVKHSNEEGLNVLQVYLQGFFRREREIDTDILVFLLDKGVQMDYDSFNQCLRLLSSDMIELILEHSNKHTFSLIDVHLSDAYTNFHSTAVLRRLLNMGGRLCAIKCREVKTVYTRYDIEVARFLLAHGKPASEVFKGCDPLFSRAVERSKRRRTSK